jgi:hypothetical protein
MRQVSGGESDARRWAEPPGQVKRSGNRSWFSPKGRRPSLSIWHKAQEISSDLLGCAKVPTGAALIKLVGRYEDARRRAQALDHKHEMDGSPPRANPSSSLWCLVDQIRVSGHPGGQH